ISPRKPVRRSQHSFKHNYSNGSLACPVTSCFISRFQAAKVEYLTQLRNSRLIDRYTSKYVYNSLAETYKDIYELQKIYLGLKKCNLHYFESNSIIDVSEEALQYHKDLKS